MYLLILAGVIILSLILVVLGLPGCLLYTSDAADE